MIYEIHTGKKYQKIVDKAMSFIIDHLQIPEDVFVEISFESLADDNCGGCVDMEHDGEYHIFEMDINKKLTEDEIVTTLFHEMKHVEQTATGKLDQSIWMGRDYSGVDYSELPWEKEAYEFESRAISIYRNELR